MIELGSARWTTGNPKITLTFAYEKKRSGADMQYRAKITLSTVSGDSYFGYPIYLKLSIGGEVRETVTLKQANPSRWTTEISYTSSWYTVANKTSGTTPIYYNVYSGSGSSRSGTYSYEMGVDAAASEIAASDGTLGTPLVLTLTRYNTNFTDTISYKCGTAGDTIITGSKSASVTWDSSKGNTVALAAQNTKGMSVDVTFTVTTYSGSTVVGTTSKTVKMSIPTTVVPTVALKVEDAAGYFATYGAYVQGYSKLKITATPTLAYGSPIDAYVITADGATYNTSPCTTPAVQGKGTLQITAKVTDARKQSNTATPVDITVLEYAKPAVTLSAPRCDASGNVNSEGSYIKIVMSAQIASLNGKNSASYTITYVDDSGKKQTITGTGTSYTSPTPIACAASDTREVSITVADNFGSTPQSVTVPIAYTLLDYHRSGKGISFGKVGTREGFDCAMPAYFNNQAIHEVGTPSANTDAVNLAYILANYAVTKADTTYPSCYYRTVDGVKEWINPPMVSGVEYRTTERWMGKPVYTKIVAFGNLPNTSSKYINWSPDSGTVAYVINAVAVTSNGSMLNVIDSANVNNIWVVTKSDYSAQTANIMLKYIKV